nr:anti-sigma regulatory factor [Gammaproteobacteria bacterium]
SDVARAILHATRMSRAAHFETVDQSRIATAVSELARNILKYAGTGEIVLRHVLRDSRRGMEIVALDKGPGIPDKDQALSDHFSSGGTLGLGLPGVQRMMDEFDLVSESGRGTRVTARKWR